MSPRPSPTIADLRAGYDLLRKRLKDDPELFAALEVLFRWGALLFEIERIEDSVSVSRLRELLDIGYAPDEALRILAGRE